MTGTRSYTVTVYENGVAQGQGEPIIAVDDVDAERQAAQLAVYASPRQSFAVHTATGTLLGTFRKGHWRGL
ncbi:hypothetical protein [Actinoplanes rectilineatus]|uniref:hypothetical protein n=1 Tax=Actinoplanes rectilineatus TaxID=113571 RepID=UPI0005F2F3C1|nr:hypothetical protein [Actinoplanes rectilineatus]